METPSKKKTPSPTYPGVGNLKEFDGGYCQKPTDCSSGICLGYTYYPDINKEYGICCAPQVNVDGCIRCEVTDPEGNKFPKYFNGDCEECRKGYILIKGACVSSFRCHGHCPTEGWPANHSCCWKCSKPCIDGYSCVRTAPLTGKCLKTTQSPTHSPIPIFHSKAPTFKPSIHVG